MRSFARRGLVLAGAAFGLAALGATAASAATVPSVPSVPAAASNLPGAASGLPGTGNVLPGDTGNTVDGVRQLVSATLARISPVTGVVADTTASLGTDTVTGPVLSQLPVTSGGMQPMSDAASDGPVRGAVSHTVSGVPGVVQNVPGTVQNVTGGARDRVNDVVSDPASTVTDTVNSAVSDPASTVTNTAGTVTDTAGGVLPGPVTDGGLGNLS